jgi:hypothetical protein
MKTRHVITLSSSRTSRRSRTGGATAIAVQPFARLTDYSVGNFSAEIARPRGHEQSRVGSRSMAAPLAKVAGRHVTAQYLVVKSRSEISICIQLGRESTHSLKTRRIYVF